MRLNLSSQIAFNKVPEEYYHPRSAVERSELTRREKIPTDIFPKMEEGAQAIVDAVEKLIKQKDSDGRMCVLGLGTGTSLTPIYEEMVRRYEAGQLSFHNVIVFNAYEYYPLKPDDKNSCIRQLHARLLDRVDIAPQNIFSPDSTINQNYVLNYCRQYEQRINSCGGIDVMLLGIGRMGNIATNEPGSTVTSTSRLILLDPVAREEMSMSFASQDLVPPCCITMGIATILKARKIYLTAWGESKADIIQKTVEEHVSDSIPASFLQRITLLKQRLVEIEKQKTTQRKNRGRLIRVALVGYTNVGKSTIMNLLAKSEVFAENKLFATLDTTVRKVVIENLPFLLADTVGFIRKLPTDLVDSFKSTLDEVREADLLVHVVDISHPDFEEQIEVVNTTLKELGASDKPMMMIFNKIDNYSWVEKEEDDLTPATRENITLDELRRTWMAKLGDSCLFISAKERENIDEMRDVLYKRVRELHVQKYPYNDFLYPTED